MRCHRVYLYTRFERFWHWSQAALILLLGVTGFEIHGLYTLFGFKRAAELHNSLGITWLVLYAFIVFWLLTTGEFRQFIPTTKKVCDVLLYYAHGIFKGTPHPVTKCREAKLNPLQRIIYLATAGVLIPFQMATGILYYTFNDWPDFLRTLELEPIALIHTFGIYALTSFFFVHIYMTLTGHTVFAHLKAMVTGWEEVPLFSESRKNVLP